MKEINQNLQNELLAMKKWVLVIPTVKLGIIEYL